MNFQDILTCLEDPVKRNEYIARLKLAGETSQPVFDLKKSMEGVKRNKTPKHIFETTMLQHTFKYCDPFECFLQFRLVCKPWKNAVETIKFDQFQPITVADSDFVSKFLPMFKKFDMSLRHPVFQSEELRKLVLNNIANLNEISVNTEFVEGTVMETEFAEPFTKQFYQNSRETLKQISHIGNFLPDLQFPKVTEVSLEVTNPSTTFVPAFLNVMKNMETIKVIMVRSDDNLDVYGFIGKNYSQHCISSHWSCIMLDYSPLKVVTGVFLSELDSKKYNFQIEYLSCYLPDHLDPTDGDWNRYQEILDQCSKLKKIAIVHEYTHDDAFDIPNLWKDMPECLKSMPEYLKRRGIEIVPDKEIYDENLYEKVRKEVGVKWRFEFL